MWISPTPIDSSSGLLWETIKSSKFFTLQKARSALLDPSNSNSNKGSNSPSEGFGEGLWKGMIGTIQSLFDNRQPPYRLLLNWNIEKKNHSNPQPQSTSHDFDYVAVAIGWNEKEMESHWVLAIDGLSKEAFPLESFEEAKTFILTKLQSIFKESALGTDELESTDKKFKEASRNFRSLFNLPLTERLVNFYSCSLDRKLGSQGWLYLSQHYLAFYSWVLGNETKLLLEMKSLKEIKKQKSKKGLLADTIVITCKDGKEYTFSNLFHRNETFNLIQQLSNASVQRLLQGQEKTNVSNSFTLASAKDQEDSSILPVLPLPTYSSLQESIKGHHLNSNFEMFFKLPRFPPQWIISERPSVCWIDESANISSTSSSKASSMKRWNGWLFLGPSFLAFSTEALIGWRGKHGAHIYKDPSSKQPYHSFNEESSLFQFSNSFFDSFGVGLSLSTLLFLVFPLFAVSKLEKVITSGDSDDPTEPYGIALTSFYGHKYYFTIGDDKGSCNDFCDTLKNRLHEHASLAKTIKEKQSGTPSDVLVHKINLDPSSTSSAITNDDYLKILNATRGFGATFGFINCDVSRECVLLSHWRVLFRRLGSGLVLPMVAMTSKLVRAGIPNVLRGELWNNLSGSSLMLASNPTNYYKNLLAKCQSSAVKTISVEEIEKDLNRSLPEYSAFQKTEGVDALRRVLQAFAYRYPEIGYCQAMNLVTSVFLIFMSEDEALSLLSLVASQMLPGYYCPTMFGASIDQSLLETLVLKHLPDLANHFIEYGIQLSVATLPWFLSIFLNTFDLSLAFRIIDWLMMDGPKVLFLISLAILKMASEDLLKVKDDGELMSVLKTFIATLPYPSIESSETTKTSKFNSLMVIAWREFGALVHHETIIEGRKSCSLKVAQGIDDFAKRSLLRNLPAKLHITKDQIECMYDSWISVSFYNEVKAVNNLTGSSSNYTTSSKDPSLSYKSWIIWAKKIFPWARSDESIVNSQRIIVPPNLFKFNHLSSTSDKNPESSLNTINYLLSQIYSWMFLSDLASEENKSLKFISCIVSLNEIVKMDLLSRINWLFNLFDADKDSFLTYDDLLKVSESFLVMLRPFEEDQNDEIDENSSYLAAVSNFTKLSFNYSVALTEQQQKGKVHSADDAYNIKMDISSFRAVVLSESLLENLFEKDFLCKFLQFPDPVSLKEDLRLFNLKTEDYQTEPTSPTSSIASRMWHQISGRIPSRKNSPQPNNNNKVDGAIEENNNNKVLASKNAFVNEVDELLKDFENTFD